MTLKEFNQLMSEYEDDTWWDWYWDIWFDWDKYYDI